MATFKALIRKIMVSTEFWEIREFIDVGYQGNEIGRF